ncbi:hypothetical protein [Nitrosomonas sp.]|uniref:hypothetical protein n=1 Tax=Nitrosomonas sp. TaxID=42353 RepID=UPI001D470600|nr:hypothetical protein [Nitrosomonas sp.]MBX3617751.1 hypothetical protein [Nitrosomonas sp.]
MIFDLDTIQTILPHRHPILLLDMVEISEPGISGKSILNFPRIALWDSLSVTELKDELILEGAAQLLGVVVSSRDEQLNKAKEDEERLLVSFSQVEFQESADLDQAVTVTVKVASQFGSMSVGDFKAVQQECVLVSGKIVIMG